MKRIELIAEIASSSAKKRGGLLAMTLFAALLATAAISEYAAAADKSWNAGGDRVDWFDDANWLPAGAPTESDDTKIDLLDSSVSLSQTYKFQTLILGGKKRSILTVNNFANGDVVPENPEDDAIYNRRDGHLILKGSAGKMTLKGAYKDSEEIIPEEPSLLFYVQ